MQWSLLAPWMAPPGEAQLAAAAVCGNTGYWQVTPAVPASGGVVDPPASPLLPELPLLLLLHAAASASSAAAASEPESPRDPERARTIASIEVISILLEIFLMAGQTSTARPVQAAPTPHRRGAARPTKSLGYVAAARGGGVVGSGMTCSMASLCECGAWTHAPAGPMPRSGAGSVLTSPAAPTKARESPQGTGCAAGADDRRCSKSGGLQTGHDWWSPPLAHVQTCVSGPCSARTSPGNPRPAASIATRIPRTMWSRMTSCRIGRPAHSGARICA